MDNNFVIITPSFNNKNYIEYNLASMLNQTYKNWRCIYIDDCSDDGTYEQVESIVGDNKKFTLIKNSENIGATYNYINYLESIKDSDIIVHLDGDDWFIDEDVLDKLNKFYIENNLWMTYGKFVCWDGKEYSPSDPQGTEYLDFIHRNKQYRRDKWRASHLRTYKAKLFKNIDRNDFISKIDKKLFWHASDLSWAFPCLEMCPKDKIGVTNFYTHVYNQNSENILRTRERESTDNAIYEVEIRNKKVYKELKNLKQKASKRYQVNAFGDYRERHTIPKEFSYVYNLSDGEYDLTILQDDNILNYLDGRTKINRKVPIVAIIAEPPHLFNQKQVYERIQKDYNKFDRVIGWHKDLEHLPNFKFRPGETEVSQWNLLPEELDVSKFKMYKKTKLVSFISSLKGISPGHKFRLSCLEHIQKNCNNIDFYGRGINPIDSKLEGLKDYKFSVAIENGPFDNYFSEKILDCMLAGTIPIYYGCPNIEEFFNMDGIITFQNKNELYDIIKNLESEDYYESKLEAVKDNLNRALELWLDNDIYFNRYLKDLI